MADKRPNFPAKPCPKCGEFIHARTQKHEACGWVGNSAPAVVKRKSKAKKKAQPKVVAAATKPSAGITLRDIQAVKTVVTRLGAAKVQQLVKALGK